MLLGLLVLAGAGWLIGPAWRGGAKVAAKRTACLANLSKIGSALNSYLEENGQRWPYVDKLATVSTHAPAWKTLPVVLEKYVTDREIFHCPADKRRLDDDSPLAAKFSAQTTWFETEGTSYEWLWGDVYGGRKIGEESLAQAKGFGMGRADQPMLSDFAPFHTGDDGGSFNTLNADLIPRTAHDEKK